MASRQPATTYEGETREPLQGPKAWVGPLILDEELRSERQPLRGLYKLTALLLLIGVATDALEKLFGVTSAVVTVQFFDIQGSQSLLTWFNSMLFLGAAALAAVIARDDPSTREFDTWSWWAICFGMLAASADEVIGAHELFLDYLRVQLHMVGVSHYVWLLPATMFLVGMSVWFIPFASRLPVSVGRRLILSAMIIGGGMIGMEMFGSGQTLLGLGVDLAEHHVGMLRRRGFEDRAEHAARTAPLRPPVDEHDVVLFDRLVEVLGVQFHGRGHRGQLLRLSLRLSPARGTG